MMMMKNVVPPFSKSMKKPTFTFMSKSWLGAPCKVGLINVYGPQSSSLKEILWSSIEQIVNSNSSDAIWIVFGDFNAVRCREERVGTNFNQREASIFNDFIFRLSCGLANFGLKPFIIFDKWIKNKDIMEVVANSWSNCPDDSALLRADDLQVAILEACNKGIYKGMSLVHGGFGLKMKLPKSRIFEVGIDIEDVETVASSFGCMHGSIPFMYLGLPVGKSMHFYEGWGEVVNRVRDRLFAWKAKSLSIGGILTLIKFLLCSIPIYHLSLFKAPDKIINLLESIRARFFWGFKDGAYGVWCGILKSNSTINDIDPSLVDSFKLKVSNGSGISFWKDMWCYGGSRVMDLFPRLFALDSFPGCSVKDRWELVNGAWVGMWSWHYPPRDKALDDLASLVSLIGNLFLVDDGMDKWVWSNDNSGSSRASINRLATRLNLVNRGVSIDSDVSPFCKACGESVNHCLLICPKCGIWEVWNWRNKLVHAPLDDRAKVREDDIFPSIQRLSNTWISARSNIQSSNWSVWISNPRSLLSIS
uniref:RNA-directed DNA polymerase, eukaryota n=1 Tax=Tanacetum cinerariifolium TaxID=118510 RepID=A0A699H8W4_TANCI|nr:RNA-directed DNA polymerase, eukaryota [Tanacetum cinerariifolium]